MTGRLLMAPGHPAWKPPPPLGEWRRRGACASYPTEWWYPTEDGKRSQKEQKEDAAVATRICQECCPVRLNCLRYAIQYREVGIWGGTDERERKRLMRRAG